MHHLQDRLAELGGDVEMAPVTGSGPSELDSFFADVNTVQSHLATVKENVARINALTKARLVEVDRAKESKSERYE